MFPSKEASKITANTCSYYNLDLTFGGGGWLGGVVSIFTSAMPCTTPSNGEGSITCGGAMVGTGVGEGVFNSSPNEAIHNETSCIPTKRHPMIDFEEHTEASFTHQGPGFLAVEVGMT